MADISGETTGRIMSQIDDARRRGDAQFRANLLVQIATLKLLIERTVITPDEAIQRMEATKQDFAGIFDREEVAVWVQWAIDLLRGDTPLHGSIIDQAIQRKERDAKSRPNPVQPGALGQSQAMT